MTGSLSPGLGDPVLVDAIIVPTARPARSLVFAIELAKETGAYLLALCSGKSSAAEANEQMMFRGVAGIAIDLPSHYRHSLLSGFATDTFAEAAYGRLHNDRGLKRNLELVFARLAGWKSIFFLDDDISAIGGKELGCAASMLAEHTAVGFRVPAFPDNSVVRHAERLSGVEPGVGISVGALMINVTAKPMGFFPEIYNEDWLFLCDRKSAVSAPATAVQQPYDPFKSPERAASEEFGDIIAEGIQEMRAAGLDYADMRKADWHNILNKRQSLISRLHCSLRASCLDEHRKKAVLAALSAALARHEDITAAACARYVKAWRHDVAVWQGRLDQLPGSVSIAEIMHMLNLSGAEPHLAPNRPKIWTSLQQSRRDANKNTG